MSLELPLSPAISTQHKRRMQPRISCEFHITVSITNHPTRTQIDLEILRRTINQPRFRLPTITVEPVRRLADGRMMRAIVNGIELCASEILLELIMNARDHLLGKVPARDARL